METYTYNHAAQRMAVKRIAGRLGISTSRRNKGRTCFLPLTHIRLAIVAFCLGPDLGTVGKHCKTVSDTDKWLDRVVVDCHEGKLGALLQEAQTEMRTAYQFRYEAVQLWECWGRWSERTRKTKRGSELLDQIREAQGLAIAHMAEANSLLDQWEAMLTLRADGFDVDTPVREAIESMRRAALAERLKANEAELASLNLNNFGVPIVVVN